MGKVLLANASDREMPPCDFTKLQDVEEITEPVMGPLWGLFLDSVFVMVAYRADEDITFTN